LLIFTDGLLEAENAHAEEYGEERMLNAMGTPDTATAAEVLQRLTSSVDGFVGLTRQHDDMTCLALRMN